MSTSKFVVGRLDSGAERLLPRDAQRGPLRRFVNDHPHTGTLVAAARRFCPVRLRRVGYYLRALVQHWEERPLSDLLAFCREYGHELRPEHPAQTPIDDPAFHEREKLILATD